ncbi:MAG: hypothetical protein IJ689_05340 [Alphaproteobacteria bacterium]|nr:hypothetical protein [Alphaproteobacteria bacterium]
MFRGIIHFFTSGMVLSPMFWLGLGSGCYLGKRFGLEKLYDIFQGYDFYLVAVGIAFVYTFAFNHVYKGYSNTVDWEETFNRFLGNTFRLVATTILAAVFFTYIL